MKDVENVDFEDTKPLPPETAAKWTAPGGRCRPRIGEGAEKVLISMEKRLLLVTDARLDERTDRSKLVLQAIGRCWSARRRCACVRKGRPSNDRSHQMGHEKVEEETPWCCAVTFSDAS